MPAPPGERGGPHLRELPPGGRPVRRGTGRGGPARPVRRRRGLPRHLGAEPAREPGERPVPGARRQRGGRGADRATVGGAARSTRSAVQQRRSADWVAWELREAARRTPAGDPGLPAPLAHACRQASPTTYAASYPRETAVAVRQGSLRSDTERLVEMVVAHSGGAASPQPGRRDAERRTGSGHGRDRRRRDAAARRPRSAAAHGQPGSCSSPPAQRCSAARTGCVT